MRISDGSGGDGFGELYIEPVSAVSGHAQFNLIAIGLCCRQHARKDGKEICQRPGNLKDQRVYPDFEIGDRIKTLARAELGDEDIPAAAACVGVIAPAAFKPVMVAVPRKRVIMGGADKVLDAGQGVPRGMVA